MEFTSIGFIVGLLMGITGAGGAVIAIPLFQLLLDSPLKEATVLSLTTVILGTGINLTNKVNDVKFKVAFGFAASGAVASIASMSLKRIIPEEIIAALLLIIGVFSIWSVWSKPNQSTSFREEKIHFSTIVVTGLFLGLITTLTGLGGGVLLIPILLKIFNMSYKDALPTSLASIFLISLSSLIIQGSQALKLLNPIEFVFITGGAIIAFAGLSFLLKSLTENQKLKLRKYVFTLATLSSLIIILVKTF